MEALKPYWDKIESLSEVLFRFVDKRMDESVGKKRRFARALAVTFVLCAEYNAGDVWAGFLLDRMYDNPMRFADLHRLLLDLGVRNLPRIGASLFQYCVEVLRSADFGDEEVMAVLRDLL